MAIPKIKGTYSLDVETVERLSSIASRWQVTKSEALRRAIQLASETDLPSNVGPLEALDRLQSSLGLTDEASRQWQEEVEEERRASPVRARR